MVAELERGCEFKRLVFAYALDVGRKHALDQVKCAGFEIGEADGGIDDRQEHDAIDVDVVLVPVISELLEHDAILLHALDKFVWAGADRMQAEFVAGLFRGFR